MRRKLTVILDLLLVLVGALLGLITNFISNLNDGLPHVLRLLRDWSIPLVGALIVLLLGGRLWLSLLERPPKPPGAWDPSRSPFPGLDPFMKDDSSTFFGREKEIRVLYDRLNPIIPLRADRLVPVLGSSGCGKSSLIQAGLLPRLTARRGRWAVVPTALPTEQPLRSLARTLSVIGAGDIEQVHADLVEDPRTLDRALERFRASAVGREPSVLMVIDQAEELLTLVPGEERRTFLTLLSDVLERTSWLWIVVVFRTEFLSDFLQTDHAGLFRQPITVGPLGRTALFEVIGRPAARAGVRFEPPSLVHRMVDDTGSGDALPLLAYCLHELWQRSGKDGVINEGEYDHLGGVAGSLSKRADELTAQLQQPRDQGEPVLRTLIKFVTMQGSTPTRRRVLRRSLSVEEREIVDAFVAARLLTAAADPASGEAVVYVTHEALIDRWTPLRQRVEARMVDLQLRARLEQWAGEWVESGRADDYLLSGERLRSARLWAESDPDALADAPAVREYLERSVRADHATMTRLADAIAAGALSVLARSPETALSVALTAIREFVATPLVYQVLIAALAVSHLERILRGHARSLTDVAWSPRGTKLATASLDGSVRIWEDPDNHSGVAVVLSVPGGSVEAVAWSPDGDRLAVASVDGMIRIWDVSGSRITTTLAVAELRPAALAWSPDGSRLAVGGTAGVRVLDLDADGETVVLAGHECPVGAVAWSPEGDRLAAGAVDWSVQIWDLDAGGGATQLSGHEGPVGAIAWSPRGDLLATGSDDWSVRIWDVKHAIQKAVLEHHDNIVCAVAWSADGARVASGGGDGSVLLWSAASDDTETRPLSILTGHDDTVTALTWSPNRAKVVSASADGTARVWSAHLTALHHDQRTRAIAWSLDSKLIATTSGEGIIRIWDAVRGDALTELAGHGDRVAHLAWSPDGRRLATTGLDRVVRIWDMAAGIDEFRAFPGQEGQGTWIAWSPDSTRIAGASMDGTVRIWHIESDEPPEVLSFVTPATWAGWSPTAAKFAVVLSDGTVNVRNVASPSTATVFRTHDADVWGASWSSDGTRLATASYDRKIKVWDVATGAEEAVLIGHEDAVYGVAWSPVPGGWLASAGRDRTVRLWDVAEAREVAVLRGHDDVIWGLAWSRDGARLATGSDDGVVRLWDVSLSYESARCEAERLELRPLTADERARFQLPPDPSAAGLEHHP
jgi:WD40 repeat protein